MRKTIAALIGRRPANDDATIYLGVVLAAIGIGFHDIGAALLFGGLAAIILGYFAGRGS